MLKCKLFQLEDVFEFLEEFGYIWEWFCEVFVGVLFIFQEMQVWLQMIGKFLLGWEVDFIKFFDCIFWKVNNCGN